MPKKDDWIAGRMRSCGRQKGGGQSLKLRISGLNNSDELLLCPDAANTHVTCHELSRARRCADALYFSLRVNWGEGRGGRKNGPH